MADGSALRYLSLFSGIEAATVAWRPLGWHCVAVAEIERFPCRVLAERLPGVPNLGDVTKILDDQVAALGPIDVVIGGSPCQDLSVAGKRAGLKGKRSSLFHEQVRIFHAARSLCGARWLVWENVPGAFSSKFGRDFAAVVSTLAGTRIELGRGQKWRTEGAALGPNGLVEWCVLDAQWFGLAQRRRRVFAVLDTGDWASRPPVLLEPESLRGDSAPRREAGERVAPTIAGNSNGGGANGVGRDADSADSLIAFGGNNTAGPIDVATAVNACASASGRMDFDSETIVTHSLRGEGFDASEDGTGRGIPLVPVAVAFAIQAGALRDNPESGPDGVGVQADHAYTLEGRGEMQAVAFDTTQITSAENRCNPQPGDPCHPLAAGAHAPAIVFKAGAGAKAGGIAASEHCAPTLGACASGNNSIPTVAFSCKDHGADAGETAPTLRAMGHGASHANAGGQVAVAGPMQVRRLTPTECERLQGFPDGFTAIPKSKDGPRYKALGNSMAVPVIRWIGRQIARAHYFTESP